MSVNVLLDGYYNRVNAVLQTYISKLPFKNTPFVKAIEYSTLLGGKRIRPLLVYATGSMLHTEDAALDVPAIAIECIHAYSLIHDDLPAMDNENLRRGQPTCHRKFGESMAILAGDALQALAYSILVDAPMPGVIIENRLAMLSELANASGVTGMCGGQALDLIAEGKKVTLEDLEKIHRYKTGSLIRSAVRLGALTAGDCGRSVLPALDCFSNAIGLAFQVQDDILDVVDDIGTLGKKTGSGKFLGKNTYPTLLGASNTQEKIQDLYQTSLNALSILSEQKYNTTMLQALASVIITRNK
ncbi:(2E,6E)-farnesyl diphosphate synthase [Candidatus Erwinia haradaeae]|uniref:Farnesyl diphosphate synthase n=1 Tax=Candidatus Erwinia haradaeae TaxID=1922217 RepID=A0A451D9M6_9GAMM|nr:(2E,6E)-farnesyl diphosphate synthase [Candidatus Erwinia haradaeae]VFP82992.1 Farnesyl diphosphate synthase [Candidatus Erwinia haradaeae]